MAKKLYTDEELRIRKAIRQKAYYEKNKDRLIEKAILNQRKRDPIKVKEAYEKRKDAYNAKRKEKYHQRTKDIPKKVGGPKPSTKEELKARKQARAKKYYIKKKGEKQTDFEKLQTMVKDGAYYTPPKKEKIIKEPKQKKVVEYKYYTSK